MSKLKKIYRIESGNGSVEVSISDSGKINVHNTFNNSKVHLMEMGLQSAEQFWEALTEVILELRKSSEEPEEKKEPTPDELLENAAITVNKEECEELLKALEEKTSFRWSGGKECPTSWNPFHGKNNAYHKSSPDSLVIYLKYGCITYGPGYGSHNMTFKKAMQILNSSPTGSPVISDNGDGTCDISSGIVEIQKQSIEDRLNNIAVQVNEQQCKELMQELERNTGIVWRQGQKPTVGDPFSSTSLFYGTLTLFIVDGILTYTASDAEDLLFLCDHKAVVEILFEDVMQILKEYSK